MIDSMAQHKIPTFKTFQILCHGWIDNLYTYFIIGTKIVDLNKLTWSLPRTLMRTPPSNIGCESTDVTSLVIF